MSVGVWANSLAIDISLVSGEPWVWPSIERPGAPANPLVGPFVTLDGRYLMFNMMQPGRYWGDVCRHIDREDLVDDARFDTVEKIMANSAEGAGLVQDEIRKRPYAEWIQHFRTLAGQWSPAQNSVEVGLDEQVRAAGLVRPVVDIEGVDRELVVNPVQFDETPPTLRRGPLFAEHTDELLREIGISEDKLMQLKVEGAVT